MTKGEELLKQIQITLWWISFWLFMILVAIGVEVKW